jgi:hypothetical protein
MLNRIYIEKVKVFHVFQLFLGIRTFEPQKGDWPILQQFLGNLSGGQNTPESILEPLMGIWINEPGVAPAYFFL